MCVCVCVLAGDVADSAEPGRGEERLRELERSQYDWCRTTDWQHGEPIRQRHGEGEGEAAISSLTNLFFFLLTFLTRLQHIYTSMLQYWMIQWCKLIDLITFFMFWNLTSCVMALASRYVIDLYSIWQSSPLKKKIKKNIAAVFTSLNQVEDILQMFQLTSH